MDKTIAMQRYNKVTFAFCKMFVKVVQLIVFFVPAHSDKVVGFGCF